ncbi:MAG TPA: AbrB/MazE/SpoVT family DNA-binding domain-containing protein [Candidatus Thermoplasmatota archaeon]|nr:AbrB/MazE/SpoVT family DNA-binding domain-containing protein [Candidatus Thermoplasmatota archaeon]
MRVVLPKEVVDTLHLRRGSHVHFVLLPDGRVEVRRVRLTLE